MKQPTKSIAIPGIVGKFSGMLFFLFVLVSGNLFGVTITSTSTGGLSNVSSTWVGNVLPTSMDDVIIAPGATVNLGANTTWASLTVWGTLLMQAKNLTIGDLSGDGTINTSNTSSLVTTTNSNTTFSGTLNGKIRFTKQGTFALTLSGANTHTLVTTISEGTLKLGSSSALGAGTGTHAGTGNHTVIQSGAVLDLNGISYSSSLMEGVQLNGTGISGGGCMINSSSTAANFGGFVDTYTPATINATNPITLSGGIQIRNNNHLTKEGDGTLTLAPTSGIRSGATIIVNAGIVQLGVNESQTGATTIANGATWDLNGFTCARTVTLNGPGISGNGALINSSPTGATWSGSVTLGSETSIVGGTGTIAITGTITGAGFGLTLGGAAGGSVTGIIGGTGTEVTKNDAGIWTLSGLNTYTGTTTVSDGILRATNNTIVASTNGAFGNNASGLNLNGGTIQSNVATFSRPITVTATNSGLDAFGSARTISSTIDNTTAGSTFNLHVGGTTTANAEGQTLTLSGVIGNSAGALTLTKTGTSTVNFSSQAVTINDLTISEGTLTSTSGTLSLTGNFSNNSTFVNNNGTVTFNGSTPQAIDGTSVTAFNNLTLANVGSTVTLNANITVADNLTVSTGTFDLAMNTANRVSAGGTLTVANNATLKIAGTNGYPANYTTHTLPGTVVFYGNSSQTIPGSVTTFHNLTINTTGGVSASNHLTVNGILNLQSANPSVTTGSLHMDPYTLTMGAAATTIGLGDVTGVVKRTSFIPGTEYTFGNQFTSITFQNVGTLPTEVSIKLTLGSSPTWKTGAINRIYAVIQTGAANNLANLKGHFLDNELNGNEKNKLVFWRALAPFTPGSGVEFGRSNYDVTNNWISISSIPLYLLPSTFGQWEGTIAGSDLPNSTWNGSVSSSWIDPLNWTPNGVPSDLSNVIIPDATTTPNDPTTRPDATVMKTITIHSGGILNAAPATTLTFTGGSGAWSNSGGIFNASTSNVIFTTPGATVSGTTNFYDVTINSGAALLLESNSTMRIGGSLTNNGVLMAANPNNTIEYNGGNQTVVNPNGAIPGYTNLILSGSGIKTMPVTAMTVFGDFSVSGTATTTAGAAIEIGKDFMLESNAAFSANDFNLAVKGNWINNVSTTAFTAGTAAVTFDGTTAQTIGGTSATTFNNLTIANTGSTVTLNSNTSISGNLTISGGAILNAGNHAYLLGGDWTNNGTFNASTSTVGFNGTATQNISGASVTTFNNINVTNTANPGVSVQSNQKLKGILTLGSNVNFDADGSNNTAIFTLLSTADDPVQDAAIAALPAGAQVSGKVTVQRYMAKEGANKTRIYRYISSPLQNATVSDIQKELPITGPFTGSSWGNVPSMYLYDETVITDISNDGVSNLHDGFIGFPELSNTEILQPARGYAIFVWGDIYPSTLWDVRGTINMANQTPIIFPVTFTSSGNIDDDGWNLIGNPFPSVIDWNAPSGWTKENMEQSIYVRNNGLDFPNFAVWNGLIGINGGSRYIATAQSFWVKAASEGPPVLLANENIKSSGSTATFFRTKGDEITNLLRITMVKGTVKDELAIHFREGATEMFDNDVDARKFPGASFNFSSVLADGTRLSINSLPPLNCNATVKLALDNTAANTYRFDFSDLSTFYDPVVITLTDNFANKTFDVRSGGSYTFNVTSNAASVGINRFVITFSSPPPKSDFTLNAPTVCEGSTAIVTVGNTQKDATYFGTIDGAVVTSTVSGTGSDINLIVLPNKLQSGQNILVVKAVVSDCSVTADKSTTIILNNVYPVTEVKGQTHCGAGSVTLTAYGAPQNAQYNWYESATAIEPVAGQHNAAFITPLLEQSTTYYVSIVSSSACESSRVPVTAEIVNSIQAHITETDGALTSNYENGNQWYFNSAIIPGATSRSIEAGKSGLYRVEVTINTCTGWAEYTHVITGMEEEFANLVSVYPNPVVDKVNVVIKDTQAILPIKLMNSLGQTVQIGHAQSYNGVRSCEFDMQHLPSGIYIVRITGGSKIMNVKVIKK